MDPTNQTILDRMRAELQAAKAEVLAARAEARENAVHLEALKQGAASPHHVAALAPSDGTPEEAIQAMRDSGNFDNILNGLTSKSVADMSPAEYRRARRDNPAAVGLA